MGDIAMAGACDDSIVLSKLHCLECMVSDRFDRFESMLAQHVDGPLCSASPSASRDSAIGFSMAANGGRMCVADGPCMTHHSNGLPAPGVQKQQNVTQPLGLPCLFDQTESQDDAQLFISESSDDVRQSDDQNKEDVAIGGIADGLLAPGVHNQQNVRQPLGLPCQYDHTEPRHDAQLFEFLEVSADARPTVDKNEKNVVFSITTSLNSMATFCTDIAQTTRDASSELCWERFVRNLTRGGTFKLVHPRDIWPQSSSFERESGEDLFRQSFLALEVTSFSESLMDRSLLFRSRVIHPNSKIRNIWAVASVVCFLVDYFYLTVELIEPLPVPGNWINWNICAFWTIDVVFTFFTAVFVDFQLHSDCRTIAKQYLKSWFFLDALTVIIQWLTLTVESIPSLPQQARSIKLLKMGGLARISKVGKVYGFIQQALEGTNSLDLITIVCVSGSIVCMWAWCHANACLWCYLHLSAFPETFGVASPFQRYLISLNWSMAQMQGSSDVVSADAVVTRLFQSWMVLCSMVVFALFLSHITSALFHQGGRRQDRERKMHTIVEYMNFNRVSTSLSVSIKRHLRHEMSSGHCTSNEENVFVLLPKTMKRELMCEVRGPFLRTTVFFHAWSGFHGRSFTRMCCDFLSLRSHPPDDIVFTFGEVCQVLYFVHSGNLHYVQYGRMLASFFAVDSWGKDEKGNSARSLFGARLLSPGTIVCEHIIWCPWVHRGDLTSLNYSAILELHASDFFGLVERFPVLVEFGRNHATRFVQLLNEEWFSDLYDSGECVARLPAWFGLRAFANVARARRDRWSG